MRLDDELVFADELEDSDLSKAPWKILIVDDDEDVHTVTKLALTNVYIAGSGLSFVSAYSASEAKEILEKDNSFALIFLDVVMEHDQAGLEVVDYVRKTLGNSLVRVIIRTGEPGSAPERMIVDNYDINDYKEKTELSITRLYTSVRSSLLQYKHLEQLYVYQDNLETQIAAKAKEVSLNERALYESSKQAQMGELLSVIAHQWRQPLSRIGAVIAQMKMSVLLDEIDKVQMSEQLTTAENYLQSLSKIISDFQNLYFPLENKKYLPVDLMIKSTLELLTEAVADEGIETSLDLSALTEIPEFSMELTQVFVNVIKNAFDEIVKQGQKKGHIDIRLRVEERELSIEIEDNAGENPLILDEKIFEPYVSDSNLKNGKGLGLYISKMIVEKHCKGRISVKQGKEGACFTLFLPLLED